MPITLHTIGEPLLNSFTFFPSKHRLRLFFGLQMATVALTSNKATSKDKLLNDNTHQWNWATITVSPSFEKIARCTLNRKIFTSLYEESVSGECIGRVSL